MNIHRILLAFIGLLGLPALAAAGRYDALRDKLPADLSALDPSTYATGRIGAQRYLAIRVNAGDENDFRPVLVFARIGQGPRYEPFHVISSPNLASLRVQISHGSMTLRQDTAHHGVYAITYQFKPVRGHLELVGLERQSITPGQDADTQGPVELWEGVSVNFLSARATYWAKTFALDRPQAQQAWEQALQWHAAGRSPAVRQQRTVRFKPGRPVELEHFAPDAFNTDFLCHFFDFSLHFHSACQ
jgi:hypothetical protein